MNENVAPRGSIGIGAFARLVGLSSSALRFYDDCDLLPPASVDDATGYRSYNPDQADRAILIRRLREIDLPLAGVRAVVDGTADEARSTLIAHRDSVRRKSDLAAVRITEILHTLPISPAAKPEHPPMTTSDHIPHPAETQVGGPELSSAIRQVLPATADKNVDDGFAILNRVLIELAPGEIRLVATDRYRLAIRTLPTTAPPQPEYSAAFSPASVAISASELTEIASWSVRRNSVTIAIDDTTVTFAENDDTRTFVAVDGQEFPDYRIVLNEIEPAPFRVVADRLALRRTVRDHAGDNPVILRPTDFALQLSSHSANDSSDSSDSSDPNDPNDPSGSSDSGETTSESTVDAIAVSTTDAPLPTLAFDPRHLLAVLESTVGPDIVLDYTAADLPVLARSADQGTFSTVVMPVKPGH